MELIHDLHTNNVMLLTVFHELCAPMFEQHTTFTGVCSK
jgi:hypothetical protein